MLGRCSSNATVSSFYFYRLFSEDGPQSFISFLQIIRFFSFLPLGYIKSFIGNRTIYKSKSVSFTNKDL